MLGTAALVRSGISDAPVVKAAPAPGAKDDKPALVLALRTARATNKRDIEDSFKVLQKQIEANNRTSDKLKIEMSWASVEVFRSNKPGYESVRTMIEGRGVPVASAGDGGGKPTLIFRDDSTRPMFQVVSGNPSDNIMALTITFKGEKSVEFSPSAPDGPFVYNKTKDKYYFDPEVAKFPLGAEPISFVLKVRRGGKEINLPSADWPQEQFDYWIIRVSDWKGNIAELIRLFKNDTDDRNGLVNPYDLSGSTFTTFGVGTALLDIPPLGNEGFDGNVFRFAVTLGTAQKKTTKVWMRFPLTKADAEKQAEDLGGLGFLDLIKHIEMSNGMVSSDTPLALTDPKMSAVWIELTKGTGEYSRTCAVPKPDDWKKDFKGPVYRLVVFQGGESAIQFPVAGKATKVKVELIDKWSFFTPEGGQPKPPALGK